MWLALVLVALFTYLVQELIWKKKKKFPPGPRGLPLIGKLHMVGKNIHHDLHKVSKKIWPYNVYAFRSCSYHCCFISLCCTTILEEP